MQLIDFLTFIAMIILTTYIFQKKKSSKQGDIQREEEQIVKSKIVDSFSEEEKSIERVDSSRIKAELSELQRLLLKTKHQKIASASHTETTFSDCESALSKKELFPSLYDLHSDAYQIHQTQEGGKALFLIHKARSKKDLIIIHEIFDKPKSLR